MSLLNKLLFIIPTISKKKIYLLSFFLFIGSLIEIVGISIFIPLINLLVKENLNNDYYYKLVLNFFPNIDNDKYILVIVISILIIIIFKTIFIISLNFFNNFIIRDVKIYLQKKLLNGYLSSRLNSFRSLENSEKVNDITTVSEIFTSAGLSSFIGLAKEILSVLMILVFLMYYNHLATLLTVIILSLLMSIFMLLIQSRLEFFGKKEIELDINILKNLTETFRAIKEIKIYKKENFFINKISSFFFKLESNRALRVSINQSPRNILEFFIALTICFVIYFLIFFQSSEKNDVLILLAVFGVAAMRLLPSINSILRYMQNLKYGKVAIEKIYKIFNEFKKNEFEIKTIKEIDLSNIKNINISNLNFSYTNNNQIFDNTNFYLKKGSTCILGDSGSGKSTFIDILLGLNETHEAKIKCDIDIINEKLNSVFFKKAAYVPQKNTLFDDSIAKNITLEEDSNFEKKKFEKSLEISGILNQVSKGILDLNLNVGEESVKISGGQLQRIGIARAIYSDPQIIILDESTNSLDEKSEIEIITKLIKEFSNKIFIFITHKNELTKYFDNTFVIKNKKIEKNEN